MDQRGSVTVEYVVVLVLIGLGCGLTVAALGPSLVRLYLTQVVTVLLPYP